VTPPTEPFPIGPEGFSTGKILPGFDCCFCFGLEAGKGERGFQNRKGKGKKTRIFHNLSGSIFPGFFRRPRPDLKALVEDFSGFFRIFPEN